MIDIPGDCFPKGSPAQEPGRDYDERLHRVCISGFRFGAYEVTQADWQPVMGQLPAETGRCDDCPVVGITWSEAIRYIARLKAATVQALRLPTEAEWELPPVLAVRRPGPGAPTPPWPTPGKVPLYIWLGNEHPRDDGIADAVTPGGHY